MKVRIQEIEEFEVTDPAGLCNPPAPTPMPHTTVLPGPLTQPSRPWPGEASDYIPGTGDIKPAVFPTIYTRHIHDPNAPSLRAKWGIGGEVIQQAGDAIEKDKWEKNWQAGMGGDVPEDGNRNTN